ncbi:hypothetical protein J1N35_015448 [Gossypium stocksii]|uniref:Uncharacterized protein n=1 Tax=Gossypium stocksii TaxID=47602 RepID=A0A9D4AAU9_9ROSI|nr:hypothetical protein J1N35_015448 [Gossypium stocksii]
MFVPRFTSQYPKVRGLTDSHHCRVTQDDIIESVELGGCFKPHRKCRDRQRGTSQNSDAGLSTQRSQTVLMECRHSKVSHMKNMDFEDEHDYKESFTSPERKTIQELKGNTSLSTLGSDNPKLGTEAITLVVREVLERVFEARIRKTSETLQARCMDCGKKRDRSSLRLEPRFAKRVRTHLSDSKCSASSSSNSYCDCFGSNLPVDFGLSLFCRLFRS